MNPSIKNHRMHQLSAAALAAICFFHIGCRRESDSAVKPPEPAPAETIAAPPAVPVVANASFEQGADGKPSGWTGTGNVVWGEGEGASGSRFAALRSDNGPVNHAANGGEPGWRSEPVTLVPGTAYELRFRCRYRPEVLFTSSQAFAGPECARQLIGLDASEVVSPFRSYSVRFVAPAEPQRIFLGAFHLRPFTERKRLSAPRVNHDEEMFSYHPAPGAPKHLQPIHRTHQVSAKAVSTISNKP